MPLRFPFAIDPTGRTAAPNEVAAYVEQMIEQVLFTSPGERVNRPGFGTGASQLLFEPAGVELAAATTHLVRGALQQWLAEWIEVQDVSVEQGEARVTITVRYNLRGSRERRERSFQTGVG